MFSDQFVIKLVRVGVGVDKSFSPQLVGELKLNFKHPSMDVLFSQSGGGDGRGGFDPSSWQIEHCNISALKELFRQIEDYSGNLIHNNAEIKFEFETSTLDVAFRHNPTAMVKC